MQNIWPKKYDQKKFSEKIVNTFKKQLKISLKKKKKIQSSNDLKTKKKFKFSKYQI